uniref:Sulfotransferase n=1 Tax=Pyramimonas obovata TaxID=1411642 RepID=A0A7S0N7I3_9CHLO|mmetsp:Transcript_21019/g.46089  ORF Transcript_21019/g.46089 Transcript_21019/m.46089 type:complete len:447 (+) Transcript_21019:374-1714(+)|eukprot:CAMPEP_0118926462 /NCGR_PEP_ID=MMETSP1169-20130426/4136_1 /TAXON_ID=36882 /ORGANISM="Pyramimonas obovata, Strain CCMP722" /LENGTH=446 /DNA_ID=CAMNT_0006868011 /DNA_START=332 /DNA_END=1672 /DNA_ORIENTATION=-
MHSRVKQVLYVFAVGITLGNIDLLVRFLRTETLKEPDRASFGSIPSNADALETIHNRSVVHGQVEKVALSPERDDSIDGQTPRIIINNTILKSLYSEACQRYYDGKVSRDVLNEVKFAGVHEPTGKPLKTPSKIQRALTWEDWALNLTTYRKRKEYNWELPVWVRTRERSSKIIRLDQHNLKVVVLPIWKSASTTLQKLLQKIGAKGPHDGSSFTMRGNTKAAKDCYKSPSMRNGTFLLKSDEYKQYLKASFVRDPLTRFVSGYNRIFDDIPDRIKALPQPYRIREVAEKVRQGRFLGMGEHVLTQMYFLSSTTRGGSQLEFDFIGKLEDWETDWGNFVELMGPEAKRLFHEKGVQHYGAHEQRNTQSKLQSKNEELAQDPVVQRAVCEIYAQDYVCLGYPLPPACTAEPSPLDRKKPSSARSDLASYEAFKQVYMEVSKKPLVIT